ncbi:MAG: hypothetical protein EAX96_10845 [Candidatus Lokiarchaeota archaeon]|nr:hypothetical protein [Candidatus Lokiarchaeota archaeon]
MVKLKIIEFLKDYVKNPFSKPFFVSFLILLTFTYIFNVLFYLFPQNFLVFSSYILFMPFASGFFCIFLLFPLLFLTKKDQFDNVRGIYYSFFLVSIIVLAFPMWVLGFLNLFIGLVAFVFLIVIGNMSGYFDKEEEGWIAKIPRNKAMSFFLLFLSSLIPIGYFAYVIISNGAFDWGSIASLFFANFFILLLCFIAMIIIYPINIIAISVTTNETGKRIALFSIVFVITIVSWTSQIVDAFNPITISLIELLLLLITLVNSVKLLGEYHKNGQETRSQPIQAIRFIFFSAMLFGYLISKLSLTTFTIWLNSMPFLFITIPDLGNIIPNLIQIVLALVLVVIFLFINIQKSEKRFKTD